MNLTVKQMAVLWMLRDGLWRYGLDLSNSVKGSWAPRVWIYRTLYQLEGMKLVKSKWQDDAPPQVGIYRRRLYAALEAEGKV